MPAWHHTGIRWTDWMYDAGYRNYVRITAPTFKGRDEDCADLSIKLLIDYAANTGLPVTFYDVDGWLFCSKGSTGFAPPARRRRFETEGTMILPFVTREGYTRIVQKFVQTKSLVYHNTVVNPKGPQPGDLMIRFKTIGPFVTDHHTALVFAVYSPGDRHPREHDFPLPRYPGNDAALKSDVTEYFRGTLGDDGTTKYKHADNDIHIDYLNSRGEKKRKAELIYFANAKQLIDDGFEFRKYSRQVLDNWTDWNGEGRPPRLVRSLFGNTVFWTASRT